MNPTDITSRGYVEISPGVYSKPSASGIQILMPAQHAMNERQLHEDIIRFCKDRAWPIVHSRMDVPHTSGVGTPDFVIALPHGRTVWIEAKTGTGKLRPEQAAWIAALRRVGHEAHVVRSLQEFRVVIDHPYRPKQLQDAIDAFCRYEQWSDDAMKKHHFAELFQLRSANKNTNQNHEKQTVQSHPNRSQPAPAPPRQLGMGRGHEEMVN